MKNQKAIEISSESLLFKYLNIVDLNRVAVFRQRFTREDEVVWRRPKYYRSSRPDVRYEPFWIRIDDTTSRLCRHPWRGYLFALWNLRKNLINTGRTCSPIFKVKGKEHTYFYLVVTDAETYQILRRQTSTTTAS